MIYRSAIFAAVLAAATPAFAINTFATFSPVSINPNIDFVGDGNGAGVLTSVGQPVTFRFLDPMGTNSFADFAATLNATITTSGGFVAGGLGVVPVTSGTISFTSAAPVTFGGITGTNLLTATFSGGFVSALIGGSTATYGNSAPPSTVVFTSSFLDFSQTTGRDLALAIDAINPLIEAASVGGGIANFSGTVSGNFGAEGTIGSGVTVPEPATWALMIGGFGFVGTAMRRRAGTRVFTA